MTEEGITPAEDDAEYWRPIVEQRREDIRALYRFVQDERDQGLVTLRTMSQLQGEVKKFIRSHTRESDYYWLEPLVSRSPPPTAAWAGLLSQARVVMVNFLLERYPEWEFRLPGPGGGLAGPSR